MQACWALFLSAVGGKAGIKRCSQLVGLEGGSSLPWTRFQ